MIGRCVERYGMVGKGINRESVGEGVGDGTRPTVGEGVGEAWGKGSGDPHGIGGNSSCLILLSTVQTEG